MKRLPLICSIAAVVALSASAAYWGLQLYQPKQRPIAAAPQAAPQEPAIEAARGLFGGQTAVAVASNYQLRGVVAAANGRGSVAIISADGQTAKPFPVGAELAAGVTIKDVQPRFVTLLEGGVQKRIDLMPDEGVSSSAGVIPNDGSQPPPPPPPQPQPMMPAQPQPMPGQPQMAPAQPVMNQPGMQPGMQPPVR